LPLGSVVVTDNGEIACSLGLLKISIDNRRLLEITEVYIMDIIIVDNHIRCLYEGNVQPHFLQMLPYKVATFHQQSVCGSEIT